MAGKPIRIADRRLHERAYHIRARTGIISGREQPDDPARTWRRVQVGIAGAS
jgi:hypothetical protein